MTLRLLKKLRTTVRSQRPNQPNPVSITPVQRLRWLGGLVASQAAGCRRVEQKRSPRFLATLSRFSLCLSVSVLTASSASAQQFAPPTIPGAASAYPHAAVSPNFQQSPRTSQQIQADAIARQMIRAQREQGAPAGFAQQAYTAQQNYAAKQDYQQQLALQRELPQPQTQQATYQQASNQQAPNQRHNVAYGMPAADPQTNTYAPPVHIRPAPSNVIQSSVHTTRSSATLNLSDASLESRSAPRQTRQTAARRSTGQSTGQSNGQARPDPTPVGLQDRISAAVARNSRDNRVSQPAVSRTTAPGSANSSSPAGQLAQATGAQRSTIPRRPQRNQLAVRQATMQQPVGDPFGDLQISAPSNYRPASRLPARSTSSERHNARPPRTRGQQISVLSRGTEPTQIPDGQLPLGDQPSEDTGSSFSPQEDLGNDLRESMAPTPGRELQQDLGTSRDQLREELDRRLEELDADRGDDDMFESDNDLRRRFEDEDDDEDISPSLMDRDEQDSDERQMTALDKSCDEFRNQLLDSSLRDIALDMSPPASDLRNQYNSLSRSWTDRGGNVIATGTMVDLKRGYVVIDSGQKLAFNRLGDSDLAAVAQHWEFPAICTVGDRGSVYRNWIPQTVTWTASSLCHKPLFFENIQLERYGHSHGPFTQPLQSVGHFFVSLATVSYQSGMHPANECQYALGFYRPGDCAPWLKDPIPISLSGARRQALTATGLGLIP